MSISHASDAKNFFMLNLRTSAICEIFIHFIFSHKMRVNKIGEQNKKLKQRDQQSLQYCSGIFRMKKSSSQFSFDIEFLMLSFLSDL
jgi:hypothetical protein